MQSLGLGHQVPAVPDMMMDFIANHKSQSNLLASSGPARAGLLQRKCACGGSPGVDGECAECRKKRLSLQRAPGPHPALPLPTPLLAGDGVAQGADAAPPIVHDVLRSPGQPLDSAARAYLEPRFGHDFSRVRVHTDSRAAESARSVNARAYTVGQNMIFGAGQYSPSTASGQRLIAHELTHVVQQSRGAPARDGVSSPTDTAEVEASRIAGAIHSNNLLPASQVAPAAQLMRETLIANPSPSGGGGRPPSGLNGCKVYLGGRRIDDFWAGTIANFRHLYINVYEGPDNYALIEGGPTGGIAGGTSGAWVKPLDWDGRGVQWDITPTNDCNNFIACLKRKTAEYHAASHPYHYSRGPNSNSFAWWLLNQCGINISFLVSSWPYLGVDYWRSRPTAAPASSASPASATP